MASTILGASGNVNAIAPSEVFYNALMSNQNFLTGTVEAYSEIYVNENMTLRNFRAIVSQNTLSTATVTFTIRKNGADTALTFTVPASSTGGFEDTTNQVSLSAGDRFCYKVSASAGGTGSAVPYVVQIEAVKASGVTQILGLRGVLTYSVASTAWNTGLRGQANTGTVTASYTKIFSRTDATLRNAFSYVSSNARTDSVALQFKKNDITQFTLSIPAGVTGRVVDTSSTIDLADGNDFNVTIVGGGTAGSVVIEHIGAEFVPDSAELKVPLAAGSNTATPASITGDVYNGHPGLLYSYATTRTNAVTRFRYNATLSDFMVHFSANSSAIDHVFAINKNGSDTGVTITVPAGSTGRYTDLVNTVSVANGDDIALHHISGTTTARMSSIEYHAMMTDPVAVTSNQRIISRLNLGLGVGVTRYI